MVDEEAARRLKDARSRAGYGSAEAACIAFGWKPAAYRHHEGAVRSFDADAARRYGKAFRVAPAYLLNLSNSNGADRGDQSAIAQVAEQPVSRSADAGEIVSITRLDLSLPMGPGATVDDYVESEPLEFDNAYIRSFTRTPAHRLRLAAGAGDSMFPTLVPNDLVWIDTTQNQLLHADRIYVASINGGAAIKRLRPVAGGRRILVVSDNKTVEPYEVDANEVVIWGRVIRFARDL
jgi:phage repressor protein C with HTH and peptisase S24 domain